MAKNQIITKNAVENHEEGLKRLTAGLKNNTTKMQLMRFLNIDFKYIDEYTHEQLVLKVLDTKKWADIIDTFSFDNVRECSVCHNLMVEGVYNEDKGEYYCCDECLDKQYGIDNYNREWEDKDENEATVYYTAWE